MCVSNHTTNVMQKLNVKDRSQAVVELIKLGELKIFLAMSSEVTRLSLLLPFKVRGGFLLWRKSPRSDVLILLNGEFYTGVMFYAVKELVSK